MKLLTKGFYKLQQWIVKIILLEESCVLCGVAADQQICQDCYQCLPHMLNKPYCPRCMLYLPPKELHCKNCQENNFYFDRIISGFEYAFPLNRILHKLKYSNSLEYSHVLSQLFWNAISKRLHKLPDIIIPVPLHINKHKLRGFNHVNELIRELRHSNPDSKILEIERIKETKAQATLNRQERINNLADAFVINADLKNLSVAIIDDVVTTGSTVNELAKLCKQKGARQVEIWCLMRAQD